MGTHASSEPPLRTLQLPEPWKLTYHALRDIEPKNLAAGDPVWEWFGDSLLMAEHPGGVSVDVGWQPEGSPEGRFQLVLLRDGDWASPLERWETRSLEELIARLEAIWVRIGAEPVSEPTAAEILTAIRDAADPRDAQIRVGTLIEHRATAELMSLLADDRPRVRYAAVRALATLGDPAAGDALLARFLLPDPDLATRRALIEALGAVGHSAAVPVLIRWLQNPDPEQRGAAASALVALEAVEARPAMIEAVATERDRTLRPRLKASLESLARISGARKRASER